MRFRHFPLIACLLCMTVCCSLAPVVPPQARHEGVNIEASAGEEGGYKVAGISLVGSIDEDSSKAFVSLLESADKAGAEVILIELTSPGGIVWSAHAMTRAIEDTHAMTVCVADHMVASAAFYLFQSCDIRLTTTRTHMMVHGASRTSSGGERMTQVDVENEASDLHSLNEAITAQNCRRLKISLDECRAHIQGGHEWWMTAWEAYQVGAVDGLVDTPAEAFEMVREMRK